MWRNLWANSVSAALHVFMVWKHKISKFEFWALQFRIQQSDLFMFASSTGRLMGESQELSLYFRGRTSAAYVFTRNVAPHARIYTKWISNEANKDELSLQTPQYQNALHADRSCANRPLQLSFTAIPPPARPLSVWRYLCLILLVSPRRTRSPVRTDYPSGGSAVFRL